jgi:hypothetical protein
MLRLSAVVLCLLTASMALGGPLPDFDAFAQASRRVAAKRLERTGLEKAKAMSQGTVSSRDERLGVPNFFWAARAGTFVRSLRGQGLSPAEAALQHLSAHAGLYGLSAASALERLGAPRLHDLGAGPVIVSYGQRIAGVPLFRERLSVVMTQNLELVALSGHLNPKGRPTGSFELADSTAFSVALSELSGQLVAASELVDAGVDEAGMHRFALPDRVGLHLGPGGPGPPGG